MALPELPCDAYFDSALDAWVLSRFDDVLAAMRAPQLFPSSLRSKPADTLPQAEHLQMRVETAQALTPASMEAWQAAMAASACRILQPIPSNATLDLIDAYARPWCLAAAGTVTGIGPEDADKLAAPARLVSAAAANPEDRRAKESARRATKELQPYFPAGPMPLRDPGFVGISQTLLTMLANAWLQLIRQPDQYRALRDNPQLLPAAVDELLRFSGVPRTLYRTALEDFQVNDVHIAKGEKVVLRLTAAHRDPSQFPDPERMNLGRASPFSLALGAGPHSCVGGGLIRMAATTATQALVREFAAIRLAGTIEWSGGEGFLAPTALPVQVQR